MNNLLTPFLALVRRTHGRGQRGVALILTLFLLLILTALAVTMVVAVSSDLLINGYYRHYRSSFYAADSGATIVRQAMLSGLQGAISTTTFSQGTAPIGLGYDATVLSNIKNTYGSFTNATNAIAGGSGTGQAAQSWPASFQLDTAVNPPTLTLVSCANVGGTTAACFPPPAGGGITAYNYQYRYQFSVWGKSNASEKIRIDDAGYITFNVTGPPPTQMSFASYGTFLDQYASCSAQFVPGTLTGPFFTNGEWNFGSGTYIFTDSVGSHSSNASFWTSGNNCDSRNASSDGGIAPTFKSGFNRGQAKIDLPTDSFNQKQAVLDGTGYCGSSGCPNPTNAQMNAALMDVNKTAYPSGGASSGVFLSYTLGANPPSCPTGPCIEGGGILVEGNADSVQLSTSGASAQIFTIKQGSTTTTITVDPLANSGAGTTTFTNGSKTVVINGAPQQFDNTGADLRAATILYVDGNIGSNSSNKGLSGPGEGVAAIQDKAAVNVTANGTINITGDILYKTQPVSHDTNDALTSNSSNSGVLGIFTPGYNIAMDNQQSDKNIEIDASIAMIKAGGSGGWYNAGNDINNLTLVGGRIANAAINNVGDVNTRNIWYDRRFLTGGFAPPWFPSTTVTAPPATPPVANQHIQRTYWAVQSDYNNQ
jgi:Tfp pilus assembly protein PilX